MKKDIILKELIREIAKDIAIYLLHLDVKEIELIDKEFSRVEKREADIIFKDKNRIIHIEIQNQNDKKMHLRMMRYLNDIAFLYEDYEIYQYLIYIGKHKPSFKLKYKNTKIDYSYNFIDLREIDCKEFLYSDKIELVSLSILCDFKDYNKENVIITLIKRLKELAEDENEFRKHIEIVSILSTNRNLEDDVKKGVEMLSEIELEKTPLFKLGEEIGEKRGEKRGEKKGEKKGFIKGKILALYEIGIDIDEIAKRVNKNKSFVKNVIEGNY